MEKVPSPAYRERVAAKRPGEGGLKSQRPDLLVTCRSPNRAPSPPAPLPLTGRGELPFRPVQTASEAAQGALSFQSGCSLVKWRASPGGQAASQVRRYGCLAAAGGSIV